MTLFATISRAETLLDRGAYLVEGLMACGTCHARPGEESAQVTGDLAGGIRFRIRGHVAYAANITPDRETGTGAWSDKQIIHAIRTGRRPDGSLVRGMPFELYRDISDRDAKAIVTYLRTLKPVQNDVPKIGRRAATTKYKGHNRILPEIPRSNPVRYGAYLAGPLGRCIECHTPSQNGGPPDYAGMLGAGGVTFSGKWGQAISGNITPDPDTGLGEFTDEQIKRMIIRGQRPNRTRLGRPMAHTYYARLTDEDLSAIVTYLRSLTPIKNFIDK